jgi:putative flavoprotein involved in K+ transport
VQLRKWAVDAAGSTLSFADGTQLAVGSVVWATGFRVDHSFIDVPVFNADERLVSRQGLTASPVSTSSG